MQKRTKATDRAAHKSKWAQSGQSKKSYSEQAGIKYATFISWFKTDSIESESGKFIALPTSNSASSCVEISFPNGICLKLQEPLTRELLSHLYHV